MQADRTLPSNFCLTVITCTVKLFVNIVVQNVPYNYGSARFPTVGSAIANSDHSRYVRTLP